MAEKSMELLVNGNFASGDLQGWVSDDPTRFKVVSYAPGKHCVVALGARRVGLSQFVFSPPGKLFLSFWHRATDEQGNPVDKVTVSAGLLAYQTSQGSIVAPLIFQSTKEWQKWTSEYTIRKGEPPTRIQLEFQNADESLRQAVRSNFSLADIEETPIALRDISLWNMEG